MNDENDCNVSVYSQNLHDANDMQSHKLGDVMCWWRWYFLSPSFDEKIYYDDCMPPIYDDYGADMYEIMSNDNHETFHHDFNL